MKQFFKMMFASMFGTIAAIGVFFILSLIILVGVIGSIGTSTFNPAKNTVYKIKLDGYLTDNDQDNPFSGLWDSSGKSYSLTSLIEAIEIAKYNSNIQGIYLESGNLSTGSANLQALRRALIDFKESGKFIVAYGDNYSQSGYFLCSVADEMYMNPQGMLEISGISSVNIFFKNLLDKIGTEIEVFKVGTYKGAVEPFILDKLSDANREQIHSYTSSIWNNIASGIADSRKVTIDKVNDFANEGLAFGAAEKAVEYGFIDDLKYKSNVENYVKELAGQNGNKLKTAETDKIKNIKTYSRDKDDQIAILYAEGEITEDSSGSIYNTDSQITEKLATELIKLKNDEKVKGVVLRVNSPGGSAYISEQIWHQVVELKKEKPIVVSMGSMAASGGYYISCAADKIVAEANTLTGSIGVFATIPNFTGTLKKIGVSTDVVKTNRYADLLNVSRPFSDDERQIIQNYVERTYDLFLTRCAAGRGMSKEEIDQIGQGRVWTGEQAFSNGLVDKLGGIDTAIELVAELSNLEDYSIKKVTGSKDLWKDLLEKQLGEMKVTLIKSTLGEDFEHLQTLHNIRSASGIQARIPYDIRPL